MTSFRSWDIVVVPFPFTEKHITKVRPAVVVSTDSLRINNQKYVLAMITSSNSAGQYGDVAISDLKGAGLPVTSVVRPSKLAVMEEAGIYKRVGTLDPVARAQVSAKLREFLAVGVA